MTAKPPRSFRELMSQLYEILRRIAITGIDPTSSIVASTSPHAGLPRPVFGGSRSRYADVEAAAT